MSYSTATLSVIRSAFLYLGLALGSLVLPGALCEAQSVGRDSMALLVPDSANPSDGYIQSWVDAAREEGYQLEIITDSQLLTATTVLYAGIIAPDSVHTQASDALVAALKGYVASGGKLMLVYDFGALTAEGNFPVVGPSRFSDIVGVDYILYAKYYPNVDKIVGWGPITLQASRMRELQIPPGKTMAWVVSSDASSGLGGLANSLAVDSAVTGRASAYYVPVSPQNPGGTMGYQHSRYFEAAKLGSPAAIPSGAVKGPLVDHGSYVPTSSTASALATSPFTGKTSISSISSALRKPTTMTTDPTVAISGYVYGYLSYHSYLTEGVYTGDVILSAPNFGLVAGYKSSGSGGVLFINTPLTYLKAAGTDGMLMHGFLRYFGLNIAHVPRLCGLPCQGGMVFNWHIDAQEAVVPTQQLDTAGVWNKGPFSIHLTAGPNVDTADPTAACSGTDVVGDGLGMNLQTNTTMQSLVHSFVQKGHQVGNHGGWMHDYWGRCVTESNQSPYEAFLVLNKEAVDQASGYPATEYSAPEGNTPVWSVSWNQDHGVLAYYFTGDTGMGATRAYRDGVLQQENIWAVPVTPFGKYATFEEFDEFGVSMTDVKTWYRGLVDFTVANRTNRMIYAHPPGAQVHTDVLNNLFNYAKQKGTSNFRWFTMTDLAKFNTVRNQVQWSTTEQSVLNGVTTVNFSASIPPSAGNLGGATWLLPKASFNLPVVALGSLGTVVITDPVDWLVRVPATSTATTFQFSATRR